MSALQLSDLVLVPCHAAFKSTVTEAPADLESDDAWVLQPFQKGEPPFYLEHIRRGIVIAANDPAALLLFSGGRTRLDAGDWSEAKTYHKIALARKFWITDQLKATRASVAERTDIESYARDSFENLLFGICRFHQVTGIYPRNVTVATWAFKAARFDFHRAAIRFPMYRFRFVGVNDPLDLGAALTGERKALRSFGGDPFGTGKDLSEKRAKRNPFDQVHQYHRCPGMQGFFEFMADPGNAERSYTQRLPWEDATG